MISVFLYDAVAMNFLRHRIVLGCDVVFAMRRRNAVLWSVGKITDTERRRLERKRYSIFCLYQLPKDVLKLIDEIYLDTMTVDQSSVLK